MANKTASRRTTTAERTPRRPGAGARIIEGLEQAAAWSQGQTPGAQVAVVQVPRADVLGKAS